MIELRCVRDFLAFLVKSDCKIVNNGPFGIMWNIVTRNFIIISFAFG